MTWRASVKRFRFKDHGRSVLADLELAVEAGMLLNVWGRSGAGKTTLFRILSGDLSATDPDVDGEFDVAGFPVGETLRSAQDPVYHLVGQKVIDEILLAPEYREAEAAAVLSKAGHTAATFGLTGQLGKPVIDLSFGQSRLLSLACLWQYPPKVLLLDEPLSGLDSQRSREVAAAIRTLASNGTAVLLAGHAPRDDMPNLEISLDDPLSVPEPPPLFSARSGECLGLENVTWPTWEGSTGVHLQLEPGQLCLVTGPNGGGKSQLLYRLSGVCPDTRGLVKRPDSVALMPQNPEKELFTDTVGQEVTVGVPPGSDAPSHLAVFFGIATAWERSPFTLSYGQKRRVSMAGTFARPTALKVFDEPLDCLDEAMRQRFLAVLAAYLKAGGMAVVATHEAGPFARFSPRQLHLDPWSRNEFVARPYQQENRHVA